MSSSSNKVLFYLKKHGASALTQIAQALGVTTMGARGHLHKLEQQQLIEFNDIVKGPGRPTRHWQLTAAGHQQFGDRHQELTIQLLDSAQALFGQEGLNKLIDHRASKQQQEYSDELRSADTLEEKIHRLSRIRQAEGYMARIEQFKDGYLLIEDHCPICDTAKRCRGICNNELKLFQQLLLGFATIKRSEHLLEDARRCCYQIIPSQQKVASAAGWDNEN